MSFWRSKTVIGGVVFLLLCVTGRLIGLFPFQSPVLRWSLQEDYTQCRFPQGPNLRQSHCGRSVTGILIGVDGPGILEWQFSRTGPFPTIVQPFFDTIDGQESRITLVTPHHHKPRILFHNLPLHYRPFDIAPLVTHENEFVLRFEGTRTLLEGIRFYEPSQTIPFPWAAVFVVVFFAGIMIRQKEKSTLIVVSLGLLAFLMRWKIFRTYFSLPLEGDAAGYWSLAQAFDWHHPFTTGPREPGFIWAAHAARWCFGDSIRSVRFLGVLMSSLWSVLTVELASAVGWPSWVGLAAGLMVATNPFAIFMSVQGYQLEFFTFLILFFAIAWHRKRAAAMGWVGALLCITRAQSFLAVIPLVLLGAWRDRWDKIEWRRFVAPFLILVLPYLAAVHSQTGSFLGHLTPHAGFYENMEASAAGQPTPAAQAPSLAHFLISHGRWIHRLGDLFEGYGRVLFDPRDPFNRIWLNSHYARAWNLIFLPFFWMGLVYLLVDRKERAFLWVPLLFIGALPMLHDLIREPRLLFHVEPFVALIVVWGFAKIARRENR
jgi:hypothetical protein